VNQQLQIQTEGRWKRWYESQDKLSLFLSIFVFLASFVAYLKTMAPTASFWDCGEFVACSYILGIAHPPGTPLFVMIGRLFTLIPLFTEVAARVNFISVLSSSLSVWLGYLLIVKLVGSWQKTEPTLWMKIGKYVGAVSGSLFLAFSTTYWSNAVEAEVYGSAMFLMLLIFYLALIWMDKKATPKGTRLLILIGYLGLLSLGIHLTTFIVMPAIFLLVILVDRDRLLDWRFWVTGIVLFLVMHSVEPFLLAIGIWFVFSLLMLSVSSQKRLWVLPFYLVLAGIIGYSVQLFIPIRSYLEPAIDENNPSDWHSFKAFLERKQYGQESMISRMFYRRGTWASQFGAKERMGFWGFFREQYLNQKFFLPIFLVGLFGVWEQIRRRKREGVVLLFLLLACTVGLVLYMNFADGTKLDKLTGEIIPIEVRDRDYFWTPGFMLFALAIGLGISGILTNLGSWLERFNSTLAKTLVGGLSLIILALPILPLERGFNSHNNRHGNYLPYDYAYNLLNSCDKDAILFTNGDNDTFPLWFLQNVEKIRQDVRVVNLSLINTNWYIKQMKHQWRVPISLTDKEIDRIGYVRTEDGKVLRPQDQMIDNIMETNNWKYPIYFAVTVATENRLYKGKPIDDHLRMEGMAYRVVKEEGKLLVEPNIMREKLFHVFKFRGVSDPSVHKDENDIRLLANYVSCFLGLADTLRRAKQYNEAEEVARKISDLLPYDWKPYAYLFQLYAESGASDEQVKSVMHQAEEVAQKSKGLVDQDFVEKLYFNLGYVYKQHGENQKAMDSMKRILSMNKKFRPAFEALVSIYYAQRDKGNLTQLLESWLQNNPDDAQTMSMLDQLKSPDFKFMESPKQP
jgi:tetratricopeptide (TPR) repeat protein